MICPKCKNENQLGNFCSECGNRLKEKCPECGKMDPIGRKVCEIKLEEVKQMRKEYLKNKVGHWRENLGILGGILIPLVVIAGFLIFMSIRCLEYISTSWQFVGGLLFLCMLICLFLITLGQRKQKQAEQKALQEFLQENPGYAEILRKAEEK